MPKKQKQKPKRFDESQRDLFVVSSYGCVDADFDDNETFIAWLREQRGRF
jgi:hypothetical protein